MATATKPKAAPKKRVITSPKVKANNNLFAKINKAAVRFIYDSGKKGAILPTWRTALARGRAIVHASSKTALSGVKKVAAKTAKRTER